MSLSERYLKIQERVKKASVGRDTGSVTLLAVSKTQPASAVEELYRLGHRDFGENYVQEAVEKARVLEERGCTGIRWHFIGHLQTNKVRMLIPFVHAVHSVDSLKLAQELAKRWSASEREGKLPIFLEVNIDAEESKTGVAPSDACELAEKTAALDALIVEGLMCIPSPERGSTGNAFQALRELELKCRPHTSGKLSMGMTADFETAMAMGSTHIRIGTALFGQR